MQGLLRESLRPSQSPDGNGGLLENGMRGGVGFISFLMLPLLLVSFSFFSCYSVDLKKKKSSLIFTIGCTQPLKTKQEERPFLL